MKSGFVNFDLSLQDISKEWYPKVRCFVRRAKLSFTSQDDLVQELMLHLFGVSLRFRLGQSTFNTFAWTCIKNKVRTLIKQSKRQLSSLASTELEPSWQEIEFNLDYERATKVLNRKQQLVLIALIKGYKKSEIAEKLEVTESRVSGILKELEQKKIVQEMVGMNA